MTLRKTAALMGASVAIAASGLFSAMLLSEANSATDSFATCESAVAKLEAANRITARSQSYRHDNPNEYANVRAYLDGGSRPTGTLTNMGAGLVALEDTCRQLGPTTTTTTTTQPTTTTTTIQPTTTTTTTTQPTTTTTTTTAPPPGCTQTISSGLQSAIQSAAAGSTICLAPGSYGNLSLNGVSKSSRVTIKPVVGASASVGDLSIQNVNGVTFTGEGGSLALGGMDMDTLTSSASRNLTFAHITWKGPLTVFQRGSNQSILFDASTFDNLPQDTYEGRLSFRGFDNTQPFGLTVSNSHFSGGCSDGIQFVGGSYGVVVGPGNEFVNIRQSGCDPAHVDPIQVFHCDRVTITGNWIHDNETGIMSGDNACNNVTVTDNVIKSLGASQSLYCGSCHGWTVEHNVIYGTNAPNDMFFGVGNSGAASNNVARNNVFANGRGLSCAPGSCSQYVAATYNLNGGSGTGSITGVPIFVGGAVPTSYAGFRLAAGSPGKGAGSDGKDMGIP